MIFLFFIFIIFFKFVILLFVGMGRLLLCDFLFVIFWYMEDGRESKVRGRKKILKKKTLEKN
jgi:hypothetical protein